MSQSDTHGPEFDYIHFDTRSFQMNVQGGHGYAAREMSREFWHGPAGQGREQHPQHPQVRDSSRDGLSREAYSRDPQSFYHTPSASMPSTSLSSILGADGRPGNGLPGQQSMVAPRMFGGNGLHVGGGDGWGSPSSLNGSAVGPGLSSQGSMSTNHNRPQVPTMSQSVAGQQVQPPPSVPQKLILNHHHHHHRASPPRPLPFTPTSAPAAFSHSERDTLRDAFLARQFQQTSSPPTVPNAQVGSLPSPSSATPPRSTLWWGELEPWMDEEYAKQVCNLMGWDPMSIKVPRPAPDPLTGRQANNPGYCFLTFPSQVHAAAVLQQVNTTTNGNALTMPNSSKPFTMNWASSVPTAPLSVPFNAPTVSIPGAQNPNYPKEYSIFVGDLAPEVSNSDLVAVFRNPVLGLRNDREPRFIRPFLSCKSAKIMLDPVTGVSRGYGFVR